MENGFSYKIDRDSKYGFEIISLIYEDSENPLHNLKANITPSIGSNICEFKVGNDEVIKYNPDRLVNGGFPGVPVLYPTPNRVRGCTFDFNGITYKQIKRGKERYLHGLVFDEKWEYELPAVQEDCIVLNTWIIFSNDSAMYEAFPFNHTLSVEFILSKTGIRLSYTVDNYGSKELPFGFALHPFFERLSGDDGTFVTVPTDYVMESTPDCLPTGKILEVENTKFDVRKPTPVGAVDIDHNYIGMKNCNPSIISYKDKQYYLSLDTSDEFTNLVLFTPPEQTFFCVENQTCATDAHNLYNQGYKKESGLIILSPGQVHKGFIKFSVNFN